MLLLKISHFRHSSLPVNAVVSTIYDGLPNTNAVISVIIKIQNSGRKWLEKQTNPIAKSGLHQAVFYPVRAKATLRRGN